MRRRGVVQPPSPGSTTIARGDRARCTSLRSCAYRTASASWRIIPRRAGRSSSAPCSTQVVVEPHRIAALVDDQRRTHVVLQQLAGYQQAGMVDALTREELPLSGVPDRLPLLRIRLPLVEVDPDPPVGVLDVLTGGVMVLPGGPRLVRARIDLPRPHREAAARPMDADRLEQPRQRPQEILLGRRMGDRRQQQVCPDTRQDVGRTASVRRVEMMALLSGQLADHARLREEHASPQERDTQGTVLRRRAYQQPLQLLGLLIRQRERVVEGAAPLPGQRPGRAVIGQLPAVVLDLDKVEPGRGSDQQVDLADVALVGDEGEVRPSLKRVTVRQQLANVVQCGSFMRERRGGDLVPSAGVRLHRPPCMYQPASVTTTYARPFYSRTTRR